MLRDKQRQKFYDWEFVHVFGFPSKKEIYAGAEVVYPKTQSLEYCQQLVDSAWHMFRMRMEPPTVVNSKGGRGKANTVKHQIVLPEWTRFDAYILHEVAHMIVYNLMGDVEHAWHGPEFVGCYLLLLDHFTGKPFNTLYDSATSNGLQVTDYSSITDLKHRCALAQDLDRYRKERVL